MDRQRISISGLLQGQDIRARAAAFSRTGAFKNAVQLLAGFAFSFAAMGGGIAPFGLAYAAMCSQGAIFAAAGALAGYTLAYGAGGLTYAAAVLICFACGATLRGTRFGKNPYLMPLCAFAALVCVKSVVALEGGLRGVAMLLCEAVLCAGFCLLFEAGLRESRPQVKTGAIWGRLAVVVAALLIIAPLRVLGDVSPARAVASFAVMTTACFCGSAMGAAAGVAVGACMDIAAGAGPFFAAAYGFSGLVGGIGGQRGRFVCAVCHVLANCVATMWGYGHINSVPGLFECFLASVIFVMLPDTVFDRMSLSFQRTGAPVARPAGQKAFAVSRLQAVSAAIGQLGTAMDGFVHSLRREGSDITRVYDRAADKVCRRCPTASLCWDKDYVSTMGALNDATQPLRQNNFLREEDFPAHFSSRCAHIKQLCGAINEEYRAHLRRLAQVRREEEAQALMGRQYQSLQGVLSDMAGAVGTYPEYYPALEARVRAIAKAYCRPSRISVCRQAGRMHIELTLLGQGNTLSDSDAFIKSLELALQTGFWPPVPLAAKNGQILRISERERLRATVNYAVRKKQDEPVCGDTSTHLHTDDGRAVVLLSDGMGTGSAASAMSSKALELISGFVKSGCSLLESTKAVLPVLTARFEQMGFVTLDLLEVNLFTGGAGLIKYGAAPSYIVRGGRVEKISGQALPAGLTAAADGPQPFEARLAGGDRVIMMSDGVWDNSDTEKILKASMDMAPGDIGANLISAAARAGAIDDMSVLVISIGENARQ